MKRKYELPKGYRKVFAYKMSNSENVVIMANKKNGSAQFVFDSINPVFVEMFENAFKYIKIKE